MAVFNYKGVNAQGKPVRGAMDAESQRALKETLKAKAIYVTEVWEGKKKADSVGAQEVDFKRAFSGSVSAADIAVFTRLLATLLKAGIPLVEALSAMVEQSEKPALREALDDVRGKVREGTSLAVALRDHPKYFDDLYINMIRAGESSGKLDLVLTRLTEFQEAQGALRSKVIAAFVYPAIMSVLGTGIVFFLMTFVVPKVTQLFEGQKKALPLITEILVAVSHLLSDWWFIIIPLMIASVVGFRYWKQSKQGRPVWDEFILKVPVFGGLARMIAIARFSKTLSTLLSSGVPLLTAMDIVKDILGNMTLIKVIEQARDNIREGESIAGPLKRSGHFPSIVTHMISVGERAGQLEEMLENVSESYSQQVNLRIQALTTLLEPIMIVVMGGVVAFIVFAIMLPILQLNEGIL
jgi:general secretion pathway protein F